MEDGLIHPNYPRPPIVEAVIELKFENPVPFDLLARGKKTWAKHYEDVTDDVIFSLEVNFESGLSRSPSRTPGGMKFHSKDQSDVLTIDTKAFLVAKLAPYTGWAEFSSRMVRDWKIFRDKVGIRDLIRVGCRFINRIDIPLGDSSVINTSEYVTFGPSYPDRFGQDITEFALLLARNEPEFEGRNRVTIKMAPSPVPNHVAIVLDIDVYTESRIPKKIEELTKLLEDMRKAKNDSFEMAITDKTRELFS